MQPEQPRDPADEAARDVARMFNRPGLRHLALLARSAEQPHPPRSDQSPLSSTQSAQAS